MKLRYIKVMVLALFLVPVISSCKKFLDINEDPNSPTTVTEKLMLPAILATFSYEVVGGGPVRTSTFLTKYLGYAVPGPHEGNYQITTNDVDNFWRYSSYTDVMKSANQLVKLSEQNGNPSYGAIAKIIIAWNMSYVTDAFGDAPFSEAFQGDNGITKPKYDTQEDIYKAIQVLLDEAIVEAGTTTGAMPGGEDLVYGGSMAKWQHLARTLKARFYLRLSNAPGYNAATQATLALAALDAGAITADEAPQITYFNKANSENPWYQFAIDGKWSTAPRPSIFYVNLLTSTDDPRIEFQIDKVKEGVNSGTYVGVANEGPPLALVNYSAISPFYSAADAPLRLLVYPEVAFIRAEAEFLKANKTVTPAVTTAYNNAIDASMSFYGITSYADYKTANALSSVSATAYEQIMTQKYITNYLQFEAYNDFRRTGYPALPINDEVYPGDVLEIEPVIDIIPLRFPYPSSERSYNAANIPSDVPSGFLEAMQVPVWWDK